VPIDVIQMEARQGPEFDGYGPIPLERTSHTGLRHVAGALSMARWGPDTGTSSWSIVVRPSAGMDEGGRRNPDRQGFAVFGRVVGGMGLVRAIHRMPAKDEKLQQPVTIRKIAIERSSARTFRTIWSRCQRAR
jgi:peptidyl-prolyl cis-trans isomerase A (cyclophilin A)